jgi:hypothetical protein
MLDSLKGALKETPSTMITPDASWISTEQAISSLPLWIDILWLVNLISCNRGLTSKSLPFFDCGSCLYLADTAYQRISKCQVGIHIAVKIFLWNTIRKCAAPPGERNNQLAKLGIVMVLYTIKAAIVESYSPAERLGKITNIDWLGATCKLLVTLRMDFSIIFIRGVVEKSTDSAGIYARSATPSKRGIYRAGDFPISRW